MFELVLICVGMRWACTGKCIGISIGTYWKYISVLGVRIGLYRLYLQISLFSSTKYLQNTCQYILICIGTYGNTVVCCVFCLYRQV